MRPYHSVPCVSTPTLPHAVCATRKAIARCEQMCNTLLLYLTSFPTFVLLLFLWSSVSVYSIYFPYDLFPSLHYSFSPLIYRFFCLTFLFSSCPLIYFSLLSFLSLCALLSSSLYLHSSLYFFSSFNSLFKLFLLLCDCIPPARFSVWNRFVYLYINVCLPPFAGSFISYFVISYQRLSLATRSCSNLCLN